MAASMKRSSGFLIALVLGWGLLACGSQTDSGSAEPPDVASKGSGEALNFSGMYEVSGLTVEKKSGSQREISGTIILAQDGAGYTSTFNLKTVIPSPDGPLHTEVIGKGDGQVDGMQLRGTARTQLVVSKVPGVDPGFAFAPRSVGARIVSTSVARLEDDGTLNIEIETEPEEGEEYAATTTTLRGTFVRQQQPGKP